MTQPRSASPPAKIKLVASGGRKGRENPGAEDYDCGMTTGKRRGRPPHDDVLTPAEWRVVHGVQHGMTNRNIAQRRGISLDAVKYHVANAIAKLGVSNKNALLQWFRSPKGSA